MQVVKELEIAELNGGPFPKRRMVVIERDDGFFTYAKEYYYVSRHDGEIISEGWAELPFASSIHEDPHSAEAEARREFSGRHGVAY